MKKFRLLLAVVVVFTLLSTFAMAANDTIYIDSVEYTAGTGSVEVAIKSNVTRNLTAIYGCLEYDPAVWSLEVKSATVDEAFYPDNDAGYVDMFPEAFDVVAGEAIVTFTATCLDEEAAVGSTFKLADITIQGDSASDKIAQDVSDYQTITVKAAAAPEPEKPVSVSTTMTVGEKEYTDVPNATVEGNVAEGVLSISKILVNYWKDGVKVNTAKEFTNFTKPNFTGTSNGTVSFKVAIMGVPSNVVITAISAQ